jgi:hypothetical protein
MKRKFKPSAIAITWHSRHEDIDDNGNTMSFGGSVGRSSLDLEYLPEDIQKQIIDILIEAEEENFVGIE